MCPAEARLACLTVGLDPGLGVLHADQNARDSLALLAAQLRAGAEWIGDDPAEPVPEVFRRDILPGLQRRSVRAMARAAGIGTTYAGLIRRGERVPHPRLWQPLRSLASTIG